MPIESDMLRNQPLDARKCSVCDVSSDGMMRGQVQRSKRFMGVLWRRDYCAVICSSCLGTIGWESPREKPDDSKSWCEQEGQAK